MTGPPTTGVERSDTGTEPDTSDLPELLAETKPLARDRIVILGRTQAGKTIYLATLYHRLWQEQGDIALRGMDGRTHKACIETVETLRSGRWPSSTVGSKYLDLELKYKGGTRPLVSLDYPGEVFRRAFVDGARGPDVDELLEHVDRAAAVIALVDPAVVTGSNLTNAADDEFGMYKALERIRGQVGGDRVPVALVLTKWDTRGNLIKQAGGLTQFVRQRYRAIAQTAPDLRIFTCSAVQQRNGPNGPVVDPSFKPHGVVAPLRYILRELEKIDLEDERSRTSMQKARAYERAVEEEEEDRQRSLIRWALFWGVFLLVLCGAGFFTWWLSRG